MNQGTLVAQSSNLHAGQQKVVLPVPGGIKLPSADQTGIVGGIDSALQVHRRKMLRRAANRKSAQLSRARKKVGIYLHK